MGSNLPPLSAADRRRAPWNDDTKDPEWVCSHCERRGYTDYGFDDDEKCVCNDICPDCGEMIEWV